jgi:Fe-S oxidoreductase
MPGEVGYVRNHTSVRLSRILLGELEFCHKRDGQTLVLMLPCHVGRKAKVIESKLNKFVEVDALALQAMKA